jgi:hypothetical protein
MSKVLGKPKRAKRVAKSRNRVVVTVFEPGVYISDRGLYSKEEITQRAAQPVRNHRDVLDTRNYEQDLDTVLKRNQDLKEAIFSRPPQLKT